MKKKLFLLGITLPSLILIPSCYYLEKKYDTIYIPGSLTRGLRCLYTAVKITNKYLYVYSTLLRMVSIHLLMNMQLQILEIVLRKTVDVT